ncbi:MAG: GHKL domain-containing protein [Paludibacteraceae bacterium]|nr:GHKL domain-containing protein [Paludibacteraceae bacterium]
MMVNEQLLGHFYSVIAGENADRYVLNELFSEQYDESVFTEEEELFLRNHFKEMVNYIIQTPCNDIQFLGRHDGKDALTIPREVIELIKNRVDIPVGSKVYNPFAGYGQFAIAYPESHFYCDDRLLFLNEEIESEENKDRFNWPYAWLKLALFANKINADVLSSSIKEYDAVMSYLYLIPNDDHIMGDRITEEFIKAYSHLRNGGKMILICPTTLCWGWDNFPYCKYDDNIGENIVRWWRKVQHEFRHIITSEGAIIEIIQLPEVMSSNTYRKDYSILIIEKGWKDGNTTMIDARFASKESDRKNFKNILDLEAFDAMLMNEGCDVETGLRKMVNVPTADLHEDLLIPQTYVVEKPSENEKPVPLSSLCQLVTKRVKDVKTDLPLDTPLVTAKNLTTTFNGALDIEKVEKANCPNIPPHTEEYTFDKDGNFVDDPSHYIFCEGTEKDLQVAEYRQSKFLDGSKDAVLLALTKDTPKMSLYQSTGNPIAVETHPLLGNKYFHVFCPKDGIDALHLLAILRNPIVYRQLQAYEEFGLYGEKGYLKDILVPMDKRIINDEICRMLQEQYVVGNLEDSFNNIKRSVRMRKHALTQSLSSLEAMFYALDAYRERKDGHIADDDVISRVKGTTVRDAFEYLSKGLKGMMPVLEHIADVEYTFAKPEWIDPELFIEDYIARKEKGWLNFKPVITWEKGNNQAKADGYAFTNTQPSRKVLALKKGQSLRQFFFPKDALEHIFKNIISNAQSWAFNDKSREDYQLRFSWHIGGNGKTLVIEIENNGTPIPEDRDTTTLLEYGVSTALHHDGHNGIGCNEIDDIMQRYDGKMEIVSTPQSVFTVKYVLTFNLIDDMGSKYKVIKPVM